MRAYYDKYGREANKSGGPDAEVQMDMAKMFFAVMFGGDKFEPYIGQLGLSSLVDVLAHEMQQHSQGGSSETSSGGLDIKEMKKGQLKREVSCALELAKRLQTFVDGDEAGFETFVDEEVAAMSKATFGEPLLHAIGEAYEVAAEKWLGYKQGFMGIEGFAASLRQSTHENMSYLGVASMGFKSLSKMAEMQEIAEASRLREAAGPVTPTAEEVAAQQAEYSKLSVRELKELMAARPKDPARAPDPASNPLGLSTAGFTEKSDFVNALMAHDSAALAAAVDAHEAWKLGGMEGPNPAAPLVAEQRRKAKAAAAAKEKADKAAKATAVTNSNSSDGGEAGATAGGDAGARSSESKNGSKDAKSATAADDEDKEKEKEKSKGGMFGMNDDDMDSEDAANMNKAMETSLPVFMQTMVAASLLDVEVTLRDVCKKVLGDHGVPMEQRVLRAKALRLMGKAFLKAKGPTKAARGELDPKHVLEGTMSKTMAKAQGQEVDDEDDQELFDNIATMHEAGKEHGKAGENENDDNDDEKEEEDEQEAWNSGEKRKATAEATAAEDTAFEAQMAEAVRQSEATAKAAEAEGQKEEEPSATKPTAGFDDGID